MGFWKPAGRQAYPGCRFRSACSSCWEAYFSALSQPISTKLALSNLQEYRKSPTEPFFSNFVVKIRIFFQLTHHFQQQPHRHHSCGRYMRYRLGIPVYLGHFCIDLYETRNEYSTEACSVGKRPASLACILASTQQARLRNGVLKQSCITYHLNAKK